MDWPQTDPEAAWEEARHGTPAETAIVLSACGKWAWLCLLPSPNYPQKPILLKRWPVAGRLSKEAGGLASLASMGRPLPEWLAYQEGNACPICGGWHCEEGSCEPCRQVIARNAGFDGAGLYHPEVVSASMPD